MNIADVNSIEEDFTFSLESRRKAEDILAKAKAQYSIRIFAGVAHGFASKADLSDENQSMYPCPLSLLDDAYNCPEWAKEEAARAVIGWFDRFSR
jgi:dienelactone hydrolase